MERKYYKVELMIVKDFARWSVFKEITIETIGAMFSSWETEFKAEDDENALKKAKEICEEEHVIALERFQKILNKTEEILKKRRLWEFFKKKGDQEKIEGCKNIIQLAKKVKLSTLAYLDAIEERRIFSKDE